jgi:hypothetical protein
MLDAVVDRRHLREFVTGFLNFAMNSQAEARA